MRVGDLRVSMREKRKEFFRVLGEVAGVVPALGFRPPGDNEKTSLGSVFEDTVARHPDNIMLLFECRQWTYAEFNHQVNQLARVPRREKQPTRKNAGKRLAARRMGRV